MGACKITYPDGGGYKTISYTTGALTALHDIRDKVLGGAHKRVLATDMDGVLEPDDMALTYYSIIDPACGAAKFQEISDAIVVSAGQKRCPYGFTLIVVADAVGLRPEILEAVGNNVRLTPGAKEFIALAKDAGYGDVMATTCAYGESARAVSRRVRINDTLAIRFRDRGDGELLEFTGGTGKTLAFRRYLADKKLKESDAFVVGDSWTDFNILDEFRPSGSVAFNPKHEELNGLATVNVYSTDLRGVATIIDVERKIGYFDDCMIPERVVFRGEAPKPKELVQEECRLAGEMRQRIFSAVKKDMSRAAMVRAIRRDAGLGEEMSVDMSRINTKEWVEKTLERHHEYLNELAQVA